MTNIAEKAPSFLEATFPGVGTGIRRIPTWLSVVICVILISFGLMLWAQTRFGSFRFALSYLQGARLQLSPVVNLVGTHQVGDHFETTITIRNHNRRKTTIVGALSDCSCVAYRGLPATIPPGGTITLPVSIRFKRDTDDWRQSITYLTNDSLQPVVKAEFAGRVVAQ